jgi:amino acid transporter
MDDNTTGASAGGPPASPVNGAQADASGNLVGVERLKANQLKLHEVVFQNLCNMAPGAAIGYDFYLIGAATAAGAAMGLVSIIGAVLIIAAAFTVAQFASRLPSAGGFYAYISHGLGLKTGTWSGLVFFLYSMVLPAEVTLIWAGLTQSLVNQYLHVNISWIFWEVLMVTVITALAYFGIKRSARIGIITGSLEMTIFAVLGVLCLVKPTSPVDLAPFMPSSAPAGWGGIMAFGLVYTILNFVGFEAAAPIAEETKNPRRNIGRSVLFSAILASVLYTFLSFAVVPGWGIHNWPAFVAGGPDSWTVLANRYVSIGWLFIYFAMTNSSLGCSLAVTNNASRVLYSMGRIDVLPKLFGRVHAKYKTPYQTIMLMYVTTLAFAIVSGLIWGYLNGFGVLAAILTIGAMIIYTMANIALPFFIKREDPAHFSVLKHIVVPAAAGAVMAYTLYRTVWPIPVYPFNIPGYFSIVWAVGALAFLIYLLRRKPDAVGKGKLLVALEDEDILAG